MQVFGLYLIGSFFFQGSTALVVLCFIISKISSVHSDAPQSVGLLRTSD